MLKRRRQRRRTVKNNNTCRSNQQKSNFVRAAHFSLHFFAVVLHDYNEKLPETSQVQVFGRKMVVRVLVHFFSTAAHFHLIIALVATTISHFVTAATKFSCCSSNENNVSYVLYLSLQISVALFLVKLRWLAVYFLIFSVFPLLYIPNLWT